MPAYKRITVKIGSNVLTRPDGTLDVTRISALVDQVAELRRRHIEVILVSSGAVASGRSELGIEHDRKLDAVSARQLFSAVGQAKLINRYYELFREHGIACGQVLTMKESFATRRHYLNQKHCMEVMLENGVIPIVNENDTVSVTELMFTDNDELSGMIATMMGAEALIILSNIDGIYDGKPGEAGSHVITEIAADSRAELSKYIQTGKSSFGRGGMLTKCNIARKVAQEGIEVIIANGKRDNILIDLLAIRISILCTRFLPATKSTSSVKKWIAPLRRLCQRRVAHQRRRHSATALAPGRESCLPIGVTEVRGDFEKDDIVRIFSPQGQPFGVGTRRLRQRKGPYTHRQERCQAPGTLRLSLPRPGSDRLNAPAGHTVTYTKVKGRLD